MTAIRKNRLGLSNTQVCKSKVKYTNLKSVERAVAALSYGYGEPMSFYRCGTSKHYHLTHTDPSRRIGIGAKSRMTP